MLLVASIVSKAQEQRKVKNLGLEQLVYSQKKQSQ